MGKNQEIFQHIFIDNQVDRTLFLFHGTGGTEEDFLFLDELLEKNYNLVGLKGNVDEEGHARFFRRLGLGVFDQQNVVEETDKLRQFLESWLKTHQLNSENCGFVGYSNGANMILALLFRYPHLVKKAALLHAMLPFEVESGSLDLSKSELFVSLGVGDQMIPAEQQQQLVQTLQNTKAKLTVKEYRSGHAVSQPEMADLIHFLSA